MSPKAALLLIDVQYDFLPPSGSLAVSDGDQILPHCYDLLEKGSWDLVVASQDFHPASHISFASTHSLPTFSTITVPLPPSSRMIPQVLWPDHCQQGTPGVELEHGIKERLEKIGGKVVRKGMAKERDDYSAFAIPLGTDESSGGELQNLLTDAQIERVFLVGLATDYCVRASALSALEAGKWEVYIIEEGVRGVDVVKSREVLKELEEKGVMVVKVDAPVVQDYVKT